jgi:hypothetical protein
MSYLDMRKANAALVLLGQEPVDVVANLMDANAALRVEVARLNRKARRAELAAKRAIAEHDEKLAARRKRRARE